MNEVSLEEMKAITVGGLRYLKAICDSNNINYYLAYGTLLGAIRHKGYIPWDDDIDIWVPRKDYYRLIEVLHNNDNKDWEVVSNSVNHDYLFEWAKLSHKKTMICPSRFVSGYIYGVSIDIFPLDDVSSVNNEEDVKKEMEKIRRRFFFISSKYRGMVNNVRSKWKKKIYKGIFYFSSVILGPYYKLIMKYDKKLQELGDGNGSFLIGSQTPLPVVFQSKWFENTLDVQFEGDYYNAPYEYDSVLRTLYGDYMQLPPEENRTTHHFYEVYYRE